MNIKAYITLEQALSVLPEKPEIHTFRQSIAGVILGCSWDKKEVIEALTINQNTLEIGGENSKRLGRALILEDEKGFLFIESDMEKVALID